MSPDSTSYPYLAIAQHYGVNYGDVLSCADYLDQWRGWVITENFPRFKDDIFAAIMKAWRKEQERRRVALAS